jgi:hypothetical protein
MRAQRAEGRFDRPEPDHGAERLGALPEIHAVLQRGFGSRNQRRDAPGVRA